MSATSWCSEAATLRVFTTLYSPYFIGYGLTLSQFAMLNVVWAATIVLAEVPSGGHSPTPWVGKLVVLSSLVMFVEITMIAQYRPKTRTWCSWSLVQKPDTQRVSHGIGKRCWWHWRMTLLKEQGNEELWPRVLQISFRVASSVGTYLSP